MAGESNMNADWATSSYRQPFQGMPSGPSEAMNPGWAEIHNDRAAMNISQQAPVPIAGQPALAGSPAMMNNPAFGSPLGTKKPLAPSAPNWSNWANRRLGQQPQQPNESPVSLSNMQPSLVSPKADMGIMPDGSRHYKLDHLS